MKRLFIRLNCNISIYRFLLSISKNNFAYQYAYRYDKTFSQSTANALNTSILDSREAQTLDSHHSSRRTVCSTGKHFNVSTSIESKR